MPATLPWPDRPVPVALVITDLDVGGAERALVALATGLDRRRWSPSVACLGPHSALVESLEAECIPVACLAVDRRRPFDAVRRLSAALREQSPRLVQSFLFHANVAAKLASRGAGRPWVVGGIRVAERRNRWHLGMERWTQRLSAGSVCVSEGVRHHAIASGHLDPDRLTVIPNGIDLRRFDECATPGATSGDSAVLPPRSVLFVGRIERQKGIEILLDAFRSEGVRACDWTLVLVGDGPDRQEHESRVASDPALQGRVRWMGRREDVPRLLLQAEMVVLPSLWEGMPNVILEAMAARKPVIATRVEGSSDLVEPAREERTGWLVPPGDSIALATALVRADHLRAEFPKLGEAGRARVERHFSQSRVIAEYERLWAGLIGLDLATAPDGVKETGPPGR